VLVDCGLYQGSRELTEENAESFGFEPDSIDFLLLTHAHLDHCGRLPLLVKRGFRGEVITTSASIELARLVLLDAAGIQEEDARRRQRRAQREHGGRTEHIEPLYTTADALHAMDTVGRRARYDAPIDVAEGIRATFLDAGHILGAASILLELEEDGRSHRVLFSGDLGYSGRPILRDPTPPPQVDTVVMETTYGDRVHKSLGSSVEELYDVVSETTGRGGNVVIPTFALERAQELLYHLREGRQSGRIPHFVKVFLDSPMAISATEIFARHPECFDAETLELLRDGKDPFDVPGLRFTRETAASMAINSVEGAVIMAGSGMCTGGRVRHHLKHNLWGPDNAVIFVGFAARGTLARRIIDGADHVHIFGEEIPVKASIHTIGGFSAHADQAELLAWHAKTGKPKTTFLVHGERETMQVFARKLEGTKVEMPTLHQRFEL
jgi:metallo-beta-lactamase family protein